MRLLNVFWLTAALTVVLCQAQGDYYPSCNNNLHKVFLNQSGYLQYSEYMTTMPRLEAFTMHYWFNFRDVARTSTTFNYALDARTTNNILTVQLVQGQHGSPQYWTLTINDMMVSGVKSPPVYSGVWHHMLHSWDSATGVWSVFMDGTLLETGYSSETLGMVIPGGGLAVSGQHQRAHLNNGMDQREGIEGWLTLFQFSSKPLLNPDSSSSASKVASLASKCSEDLGGNIISWRLTPRKGYGGVAETPGREECGNF